MLPYRELHPVIPIIMMNHAAYPVTSGRDRPASASPFWITTVLRKRIGYRGIVFSDDFEMGGILKFLSIEDATIAAIRAGMDVVEICHSPELILRGYEALVTEAERSAAFRKLMIARARDVSNKRKRLYAKSSGRPLAASQLTALRDRVLRFNESIASSENEPSTRTATSLEVS